MAHRVAIIGAGDIVRKAYLPNLVQQTDCRIVAICSRSGSSAHELAEQYAIPVVCQNYQELLQKVDVDAVFICTPTAFHRPIAEAVIASQRHVLVEKPLCATYNDSHILLQKAKQYNGVFYPAFNNHFREENQYFHHRILTGEIGAVELLDFEWYRTKRYTQKAWLYDPSVSGGGVLIDLGAHLIHLALGLFPDRETFSAACINHINNPKASRVEDLVTALICINKKVSILIKLGWDMALPVASRVELQAFGRNGLTTNQEYQGEKTDGYKLMIRDFFDCIESGMRPDLRLADDTMHLLDGLYRSARKGVTFSGHFMRME